MAPSSKSAEREIDISNVQDMGLSSSRFPTSSVQAYEEISIRSGRQPSQDIRDAVYEASATVFMTLARVYDSVEDVLRRLQEEFHLGLLTKGDLEVQKRRINQSGLEPYFKAISIVSEKSESEFLQIVGQLRCSPESSHSVGNSLGSDVLPALSIGMSANLDRCTRVGARERPAFCS